MFYSIALCCPFHDALSLWFKPFPSCGRLQAFFPHSLYCSQSNLSSLHLVQLTTEGPGGQDWVNPVLSSGHTSWLTTSEFQNKLYFASLSFSFLILINYFFELWFSHFQWNLPCGIMIRIKWHKAHSTAPGTWEAPSKGGRAPILLSLSLPGRSELTTCPSPINSDLLIIWGPVQRSLSPQNLLPSWKPSFLLP